MICDRAFIFHIYIPPGKALSLVPKTSSSGKVNVKFLSSQLFEKMAVAEELVFHQHILFFFSFQKSLSTEELTAEMANLEGLMKDLNAITQQDFECSH